VRRAEGDGAAVVLGQLGRECRGLRPEAGIGAQGADSWYVAHLRGVFFIPKRQVRTFRIDPKDRLTNIRYFLTLDGHGAKEVQTRREQTKGIEVSESLAKGVHQLDVYVHAQRAAAPAFDVMMDVPEPPYMAVCQADMFSRTNHAELAAVAFRPTEIKAEENGTRFTVDFQTNNASLNARVLRLWLLDFETDAPAIRKVSLLDAAGQPVLPTREDLMELRKNQILEIIPGDKVSMCTKTRAM